MTPVSGTPDAHVSQAFDLQPLITLEETHTPEAAAAARVCESVQSTVNPPLKGNGACQKRHADDVFDELVEAYGTQGGSIGRAQGAFRRAWDASAIDEGELFRHVAHPDIRKRLGLGGENPLFLWTYIEEQRWLVDPAPFTGAEIDRLRRDRKTQIEMALAEMDAPTRAMWREAMELRIAQPFGGGANSAGGCMWLTETMQSRCCYETVKAELDRRKTVADEARAIAMKARAPTPTAAKLAAELRAKLAARTRRP
jgi:hypothetical protein